MPLHIVILAAGQGKRMFSALPKVLHPIGGKAMLAHVIECAQQLEPAQIHIVVGHEHERIMQALNHYAVNWVTQTEQLGTGHAVMQVLPHIPDDATVLILSGDVPLIKPSTLQKLLDRAKSEAYTNGQLGLLLATLANPFGLGRIKRNETQQICAIIEEKDATETERQIQEIYSGICCARAVDLQRWLPQLQCNNAQNEYYLTSIISLAVADKTPIYSLTITEDSEILGVNNRLQLQQLERLWQKREAEKLMLAGTTIADAARIDIRGELHCGRDVFIDINTVFQGTVLLGDHCSIGANCVLTNVTLGENCHILPNSHLDNCILESHCEIGPFARLRPGTRLAHGCKVGNFVEMKNTSMGPSSKANHLSYLGDALIGAHVNVGAGTITCNYDGANKHQTIIEDGVHIGSDTQLVAPVTIGKNATIGAGSTIRKNVPADELTLTISTQKTVSGWKRKEKQNA